ncbi:hypothetical protein ACM39_08710 [Chryseobacterium sp. FH2]|uniref:hypothetical protein n=1 Tax=Chryseobacterium sp. FH2 TaxID=1674291 RepID=UPI00065AA3CE|nr:hypothetical protein [Chryseobacterium sp. FH2]KMQ68571.1 hypothetical protein ACM39_08710 [Chryseobacterium sp. FH2]
MKLIEIIEALRTNTIQDLLNENSVAIKYDLIDIYAKYSLGIESDYYFFNAKKRPRTNIFEENGIKYENLCSLSKLKDLVCSYANLNAKRTSEILVFDVLDYLENEK